jgi:hypothetical protein
MLVNRLIVLACATLGLVFPGGTKARADQNQPAPASPPYTIWNDTPPAECPFPQSPDFAGLGFTGQHAEYGKADTWYPSWASDGNMYSPFTDGDVNGVHSDSNGSGAITGFATLIGDDPHHLQITNAATYPSSPAPYHGRYPCGSLVYNGVWYYGTYCLDPAGFVERNSIKYNWPWLGPFVGFRTSTDLGKTWTQTPHTPAQPLFGENGQNGNPVKIGSPHFVDFGKNMEHSPDGKAYLVAHGASEGTNRRYGYNSWITGDNIYLIRVTPSIANLNDASQYEFYAGQSGGAATWTHDFTKIEPIAAWKDHLGCVTMTYDAPLKKYLMCITDGRETIGYFNTMILESDAITGPWKRISYLLYFGEEGYFVNFPSKFISADGRSAWLCYAANFAGTPSNPPGSGYHLCLQQVELPKEPVPPTSKANAVP